MKSKKKKQSLKKNQVNSSEPYKLEIISQSHNPL